MKSVRAFLAVPLPASLQQSLALLQADLSKALPCIRWAHPDSVHLTLRFFGATGMDDLEKIRASMLSVALHAATFQVDVCELGAFPTRHRPRVVWLGLTPEESLRTLYQSCQRELTRAGIAAEPRAFAPHLTIGRFRERGPDLTPLLVKYAGTSFGSLPVEQLVLFESRLLPGGARHLPLFNVPLQRDDYPNESMTTGGRKS